jgi:hypothetical protein
VVSDWASRKLGLKEEHIAALRDGCGDFTEDDLVLHIKACDTCTRTVLLSGLFPTRSIVRMVALERMYAVAEPGRAALRFTTFRPCESCGAEIYGTRQPGRAGPFWANRLDNRLHACADFRKLPNVVEAWAHNRSKGWKA